MVDQVSQVEHQMVNKVNQVKILAYKVAIHIFNRKNQTPHKNQPKMKVNHKIKIRQLIHSHKSTSTAILGLTSQNYLNKG